MLISDSRGHAAARCALHIALLDQIGFQHIFDGATLFADGGGEIIHAHRTPAEFFHHGQQQLPVHHIEADEIDIQHNQVPHPLPGG